ncbi:GNAT family N-acetyltransferase [Lysobacter sp. Hz 25]|uniref:GNAT family N-acetyltransferase n=1 Tax=Lysobacter sp. Hz 25 TaxID=3383698 RepID=UPI0038D3F99E
MSITVEVARSLEDIDREAYQSLYEASGASFFYDWRFLDAAERSPLLEVLQPYYLALKDRGRLVAFLPAYLQRVSVVDPFGLLAARANLLSQDGQLGLFSHVMHCFDSSIVSTLPSGEVLPLLLNRLAVLARQAQARYFGLLNVADGPLLRHAADHGLSTRHVVDRYYLDFREHAGFDALVAALPTDGRREMTRQLRRFAETDASVTLVEPPFDDRLEQLAQLCQQTTARYGTPQYFPAEVLAQFVRACGNLARLCLVEHRGVVAGGLICFLDKRFLCIWSAGMRYDRTDFSPYTISFAQVYRHAFEQGIPMVEAGRLNERIKARLGLKPLPLYAATGEVRAAAGPTHPHATVLPEVVRHGIAST